METPNDAAGAATERIMSLFWNDKIAKLETSVYNQVYSHVLSTVRQELEWWHRNWHRDTGIPCDGTMEVCMRAGGNK